jgi:RNA-directed DNA polymerase
VRDAEDGTIDVKSARAGERVLASVTRFLARRLKLAVNAATSAVDRPWRRTLLGLSCMERRPNRRRGSDKALKAFKHEVRRVTHRTRGVSRPRVIDDLRGYLEGWYKYVGVAETQSGCKELASWSQRRLRCYRWQPWGRRGYRELRQRGVSRELAWNTYTSAHGPWRLSRRPALACAFPGGSFAGLGVPRLHRRYHAGLNPPNRRRRAPYVRWCGRGEAVRSLPIPIRRHDIAWVQSPDVDNMGHLERRRKRA